MSSIKEGHDTVNHVASIDYLNAVDDRLEHQYGITSKDIGTECILRSQAASWSPKQCVAWLSEKYELERIDLDPFGGEHA